MTNNYLVQVSIGPVQEFIAEARKVRDLWIGSQLISFVAGKAIEPFLHKAKVILPAQNIIGKTGSSGQASMPNQVLVLLREEELYDLVKRSKQNLETAWDDLTNKIRKSIDGSISAQGSYWKLWSTQLKDLWQYIWVAVPISDNDLRNKYEEKVREVQKSLEARKATRSFAQCKGNSAFKCTQCGKREVMGPEDNRANQAFWRKSAEKSEERVKKGDRLCAVCLAKRFIDYRMLELKEPMKFDSTADLAAASYKRALKGHLANEADRNDLMAGTNRLLRALGRKAVESIDDIPGILFFSEELKPERLMKEFFPWVEKTNREEADTIIKRIEKPSQEFNEKLNSKNKLHKIEPCKYYALFSMDGDKIGKWLSEAGKVDEQKRRSELLGALAEEMCKEFKGKGWVPIYSGGDDFLAMGPLEEALAVALQARGRFSQKLGGKSASAALVISHYHNPLRKALQTLRENVEQAKDVYNRDSLVLTVWLGSGAVFTGGHQWHMIEKTMPRLLSCLEKKTSPAFIYDVLSELDAFYDDRGYVEEGMFTDEARRLLGRHLSKGAKGYEVSPEAQGLLVNLSALASRPNSPYLSADNVRENFINILRISSFIDRQQIRRSK